MIRINTSLFFIIISLFLKAQSYQITFEATGASTVLDSVLVENLTQGTNLKLLGNDTLLLDVASNINYYKNINTDLIIYPNPSQGLTNFSFYAQMSGKINILICDIFGKTLLQQNENITKGYVTYQICGLTKGIFFITVKGDGLLLTGRLVNLSNINSKAQINRVSNIMTNFKNKLHEKLMVSMPYSNGEIIKYTGYSGNLSAIITDMPTSSKTITFNFVSQDFNCGDLVNFQYNGTNVIYGTVNGDYNGGQYCWLDRNLGASAVATAYNHSVSYGDLFQWGRLDDRHQLRTSGTTTLLSNNTSTGHSLFIIGTSNWYNGSNPDALWQGVSGVNNPCPPGWRLPTDLELDSERLTWAYIPNGGNNYIGATNSALHLPTAGIRDYDSGLVFFENSNGYYWSSTVYNTVANLLSFNSGNAWMAGNHRAHGFSVRCIMDY